MRAILIDPELQTVRAIELREGLDEMCSIIGCDGMEHALISDQRDTLWVDEHGLSRGQPVYAFKLRIIQDPFAGKAIVIGADHIGQTCAPYFPIELLRHEIIWLGLIVPEVTWINEPNGARAVVTYSRQK